VVAAETAAVAADAAALVEVDYEPLPAVADLEDAVAPDAPLQFPDLGSNVAAGLRAPDKPDPLAGAEIVVRARMVNQRVAVVPMEGNAIAVAPEPDGRFTVWVSTQMPHLFRTQLARVLASPRSVCA
jgi:aerobic carbon-monoxide dehydrogenase large subunit